MKKFLLFLLLLSVSAFAQPGTLDTSFNPSDLGFKNGYGTDQQVQAVAVQPDGKILIGGLFSTYNGVSRPRITRLNENGTLDMSFNTTGSSFNQAVTGIKVLPSGKILVHGSFTSYNGSPVNRIARLNADGTLDATFISTVGANAPILAIAIQPADGKIIIVGQFTTYNGIARNRVARIDANGGLDATFAVGTGANDEVDAVAFQSNGKLIIGGYFLTVNGNTSIGIARLNTNGSFDTAFQTGSGFVNGGVHALAVQWDDKIIAGGNFSAFSGNPRNGMARLSANGIFDNTYTVNTGVITSITKLSNLKLLLTGNFNNINGVPANHIAMVNLDGTLDTTFNVGTGPQSHVMSAAIQPDNKIVVCGPFTSFNNNAVTNYVARVFPGGTLDPNFNKLTGVDRSVYCSATQPDGKIILGGDFLAYNGAIVNRIVRVNPDGSIDNTFSAGSGPNDTVYSISIQPDGKIVIGGFFNAYNGVAASRIVRLNADGSRDVTFNMGSGADNWVYSTALQADGKILIGGLFTNYNGVSANRIARLNSDGSRDTSFAIGTASNSFVQKITIQSDAKIIVAGGFTSFNGTAINRLIRLNSTGTVDTSFSIGSGFNSDVTSAVLQADGKMVVVGDFTTVNSQPKNRIVRLNADGTLDTSFAVGTGFNSFVRSVEIQADNSFIAYGYFNTYNGTSVSQMISIKADGSVDTNFAIGTGPNSEVVFASLQPDGKIIIGGQFTGYNGTGRNKVARINGNLPPTVSISGSISSQLCENQPLTISFTTTGSYTSGNIFTAQLSDVSGSFASPTTIGTLTSTAAGDIAATIPSGITAGTGYRIRIVSSQPAITSLDNGQDIQINALVTYYLDADGDGFGNGSVSTGTCSDAPEGYVANALDCNDALLTYVDADADGFGSTTFAPCGIADNTDCDDNQLQYVDADGDGFGSATYAACSGILNNSDCNDALLTYVDADADGFGSTTFAPCGIADNTDCDDNQLQYVDADGDGFGSATYAACGGILNNSDCNDALLTYVDADADGFGSTTFAPCGISNNTDCNDNNAAAYQGFAYYADTDGDGYGSGTAQSVCAGSVVIPAGYSDNDDDCDDTKSSVHPFATEIGYNLIDDDCDGAVDEGFPPKTTVIQSTQCNNTLTAIDNYIYANLVAGAQGYRWRITTMSGPNAGQIQFITTALRALRLTQLGSAAFNTVYKIETAVYFSGYLQPFTPSNCTVTTPAPVSALVTCGQSLTSMNDVVYATSVPFAAGYRFRVSDPANPLVFQEINRSLREFRMNLVTAFSVQYGKTYNVEVAVKNTDGTYLSYGTVCQVTTPVFPTTFLQDSQCNNYAVPASSARIYANPKQGAIGYVFSLSGPGLSVGGAEVVKPVNFFTTADFSGLIAGALYDVKVRVIFNTTDEPGPFGKVCTILAPVVARTNGIVTNELKVLASPNPFDTNCSIVVSTGNLDLVRINVYDMTGRLLETHKDVAVKMQSISFGDKYPAGVYIVLVSQGDETRSVRVIKR
jgi:uncharacterized delta-60 repeat protein